MRTEKEMFDLILNYASQDERVRVVGLNGSRANDKVPKDEFQDYDIAYMVTDIEELIREDTWISIFGERIMMQKPETMSMFPHRMEGWFTYLMLFQDGNRIDLTLIPIMDLSKYLNKSRLTMILLDKDGLVGKYPPPSDESYHVQPPSKAYFDDCCSEFWWVATYVAKGLCRDELLYASNHMESCVRKQLLHMLTWKVGVDTGFQVSVGKLGKYLKKYISGNEWTVLLRTYRLDTVENAWEALFAAQKLFREVSIYVGYFLGCEYPQYDNKVSAYIARLYTVYQTER